MKDEQIVQLVKYIVIGVLGLITLLIGSCQMTNYQIAFDGGQCWNKVKQEVYGPPAG